MNKAKNKSAAAKAADRALPARTRDLDVDVFDVANNAMLRNKVVDQYGNSSRAALRAEWDEGTNHRSLITTPESMDKEALAETEREEVRNAVDAVWAKADKLKEQAVAAASITSTRTLREQLEAEKKAELEELEARLRSEAEEAIGKIWETANREKARAVEEALQQYAEEKAELARTREREKKELDEAYKTLKGEIARVLEKQHAKNLTEAVNTAWERATRQEELAVAQAIERTRAELLKEQEETIGKERLNVRAEARRTIAECQEAHAEERRSDQAELKKCGSARTQYHSNHAHAARPTDRSGRLRELYEDAKQAALVAEHKAASEQPGRTAKGAHVGFRQPSSAGSQALCFTLRFGLLAISGRRRYDMP